MNSKFQQRQSAVPRPEYDESLPITAHRQEIIDAIRANPVTIIAGETGSGKTTQLPKMCLQAGRGIKGLVGCTQPRRIAARAMAVRVAEELGSELGKVVGYQVRFRDQTSPENYIKFMTDGILLAEASTDRLLRSYDTIIIDEAHERSLNIDFLLGFLKQLLRKRRDLKVIITSATIDTDKFSRHFDNAPVINVSGRGYPVDVIYQPLDETESENNRNRDLYKAIGGAVQTLSRIDHQGDILVFLSGEREIHEARDFLDRSGLRNTEVLPLYSRLSAAEQQRVFHPGPQRRIILSTNVAETSLTVPRIRFVIDSGLARISRYAHRSRVQRLPIEPVSQASANQRMGRCGRLGPGTCVRLFSQEDFDLRAEFTEPEILRTSLATVILRMLTMGLGIVEKFPFIDPPAPRMINDAHQLLFELGALDKQRDVTPMGKRLSRWPLDVRLARMLEGGIQQNCFEDMLVLASALSIQDPRERPLDAQEAADESHQRFSDDRSDFVAWLKLWQYLRKQRRQLSGSQFRKQCRREFLHVQRILEWFDLYQQLRDQAREQRISLTGKHGDYDAVHQALITGLLSQVGQRDPEDRSYTGARNRRFHIFPGSGLFGKTPQWIVSAEIVETTKPYARVNARINPEWLERLAPHLVKKRQYDPHWSSKRGRVMAWEQVSLYGLILVEKRPVDYARYQPDEARDIFILKALVQGGLDSRAEFLAHNQRVLEQVEQMEHKRRQRDVLVDERVIFEFFDARLPAGVNSAKAFSRWLEKLDDSAARQLMMSRDVLLRDDAATAPGELYPDHWDVAGKSLPLQYRFDPGHVEDGVSVLVPLELLNTLTVESVSWLVPGLIEEKLVELMRTLPKPLRRAYTPIPQFANAVVAEMSPQNNQSVTAVLADRLGQLNRTKLKPADFNESAIPEHLRMRVVVLDQKQNVQAQSRDLASLQDRFGQQAQRQFMDRQGKGFNQDGLTQWSFDDLPASVKTASGSLAYPALVEQGEVVGLRLFDTWEEAITAHYDGLLRLLSLGIQDKLGWLRKHHGISRQLLMSWTPLGDTQALIDELVWYSLTACAGDEAIEVRTRKEFEQLVATVRSRIGLELKNQAEHLSRVLDSLPAIRRDSSGSMADKFPGSSEDMRSQLEDMLYDGFLLELGIGRLQHFPRYLEALSVRIERLKMDPGRDLKLMQAVSPHWERYLQYLEDGQPYTQELDQYRWLVAEFRVSQFAQQLGTAGKVSAKRLDGLWQQVMAAT